MERHRLERHLLEWQLLEVAVLVGRCFGKWPFWSLNGAFWCIGGPKGPFLVVGYFRRGWWIGVLGVSVRLSGRDVLL